MDSYNQVEALPVLAFGFVLGVVLLLVWKSTLKAQIADDSDRRPTNVRRRDRGRSWRDDFYEL